MNQKTAISKINAHGALLVFPLNNNKEPKSLWSEFFPKSKLRLEWDEGADNRVSNLWYLMKKLSDCRQVVYSKWYQGRATFFSRELFVALLSLAQKEVHTEVRLSRPAKEILDTLESDSPLSTKQLKKMTELQGKDNQATYNRAMKELFSKFYIVAYGEVDDGAFPSLAIGATSVLYEDLWNEATALTLATAKSTVKTYMHDESLFYKFLKRVFNKGVDS